MTEVDANHASSFHIDHEVGEVAVSDAKNPVTDTQQSMRADEVGSQGQEGLRAVAHPQERPPTEWKHNRVTLGSPSTRVFCRQDLLQQVRRHVLQHLQEVVHGVGTLGSPV